MWLIFSRHWVAGLPLIVLPWILLLVAATPVAGAGAAPEARPPWSDGFPAKPKVPLSSVSRWIVDSDNARVKLRCINWAGHLEVNIPEGLQWRSVEYLAGWIAGAGFNCVRLTYSIDMAMNPDVPVRESFLAAAGGVDEAAVELGWLYDLAVVQNPFLANATVLDVFDRVVSALWDVGVMVVLDNHVSAARWCCNLEDGNGWWSDAPLYSADNSRYFDTGLWLAGLGRMATWARGRPGVVAMSLRNEMRATLTQIAFATNTWYAKVGRAAGLIHAANPDLLVVIGGLNGGTDLMPIRAAALNTSAWAGKNVWEAHVYSFTITTPSFGICDILKSEIGALVGFVLEEARPYTGPLWVSEFGISMNTGPNDGVGDDEVAYLDCIVSWMEHNDVDWALWALQGSYYIRDGVVERSEDWGALDDTWTDWRNPKFKSMLGKMFNVTQGP